MRAESVVQPPIRDPFVHALFGVGALQLNAGRPISILLLSGKAGP